MYGWCTRCLCHLHIKMEIQKNIKKTLDSLPSVPADRAIARLVPADHLVAGSVAAESAAVGPTKADLVAAVHRQPSRGRCPRIQPLRAQWRQIRPPPSGEPLAATPTAALPPLAATLLPESIVFARRRYRPAEKLLASPGLSQAHSPLPRCSLSAIAQLLSPPPLSP